MTRLLLNADVRAYFDSPFERTKVRRLRLPLADEPHVAIWREYEAMAGGDVFDALRSRVVQLRVPVQEGCSASDAYARVMRKGEPFNPAAFGGKELRLEAPAALRLEIHDHFVGALPVLTAATRGDFETLYRALACRSEPAPMNRSVDAQMIAGIFNSDRASRARESFLARGGGSLAWPIEMKRMSAANPGALHDKVMLTWDAPYRGKSAHEMGLPVDDERWLHASARLRIEHEFAHYATTRLYGAMRLNLLDELVADAMGMTSALGRFEAGWFLTALGLESWPQVRDEARVHTYCQDLPADAFAEIAAATIAAAYALERLAREHYRPSQRPRFLLALSSQTLDGLAAPEAPAKWADAWAWAATVMGEPA